MKGRAVSIHEYAFLQNQRLGRGVNIIGYDPIWQLRSEGRLKDKHLRLIHEAGFDHVRINLHPFKHMGHAPDYRIDPAWLDTLDWVVNQSLKHDLAVILDMHQFNAMGKDPAGLKPRYLAAWAQLALRFADAPDTVSFELLNEPNGELTSERWNELLTEPYAIIRESNPDRTLIIGPAFWNGIDHVAELEIPESDRNIIVTVHYYHPMEFTHQGAPWSKHADRTGVTWDGTDDQRASVVSDLHKAQTWSERYDRPILLGEFGAYDKGDMESRARYTSFVARHAETLGWSWSYWQFDSDFVVYDIDRDTWVEPIRSALIPL